jgi:CheY-like chemotaxis protein
MTAKSRDPSGMIQPRILVVDDEYQIHVSLRLRLSKGHDLEFSLSASDALAKIAQQCFDLCLVDINMPDVDGLRFIDAARKVDAHLGYVVVSAFDTDENLRRTIPLQVYDFVPKPLPHRHEFEGRIPDWVEATRRRRREHNLAAHADTLASERDSARMERDVELVASESARDALLQAAGFLSTSGSQFLYGGSFLTPRVRSDPTLMPLLRAMEEGRKATEAMINIVERFLGSNYGSRDESPALVNDGIRDAINLAKRDRHVGRLNKAVHFVPLDVQLPLRGLSGIAFLLMIFPALTTALSLAAANSTVGVRGEYLPRLDSVLKDHKTRQCYWLNRRHALISHPCWLIEITASAPPFTRPIIEQWLGGAYAPLSAITARGIIEGVQKSHGLLGFSVAPHEENFRLLLALPTSG